MFAYRLTGFWHLRLKEAIFNLFFCSGAVLLHQKLFSWSSDPYLKVLAVSSFWLHLLFIVLQNYYKTKEETKKQYHRWSYNTPGRKTKFSVSLVFMKGMSIGTTKTIRKILQNLLHEKKNWHAGNSSIFVTPRPPPPGGKKK